MNLENYKTRFQKVAQLLPEHENLKNSFKYFTLFMVVRNIKYLYAAVQNLEEVEKFANLERFQ